VHHDLRARSSIAGEHGVTTLGTQLHLVIVASSVIAHSQVFIVR